MFVNGFWAEIYKITKWFANAMWFMYELAKKDALNSG